jgi:hypothetical protein
MHFKNFQNTSDLDRFGEGQQCAMKEMLVRTHRPSVTGEQQYNE